MSNAVDTQYCAKAQLQPLSQEAMEAPLVPAEDITYLPAQRPLLTPTQVATAKKLGGYLAYNAVQAGYYSLVGIGSLILLVLVTLREIGKALVSAARPSRHHADTANYAGPAQPHINVDVKVNVNIKQ